MGGEGGATSAAPLRPYYADADVQVYCADALALLRSLPAASVDLIAPDLPYFRVKDEEWDRAWPSERAFLLWVRDLCREYRRVLKPNGSLYLFASPQMAHGVERVVRRHFNVLNVIRWEKDEGWHKRQEKEALRSYLSPWEAVIFAEQFGCEYEDASTALHAEVFAPVASRVREIRERAGLKRWEVDVLCAPSKKPTGLCYRWENAGHGHCRPSLEQLRTLASAARVEDPDALWAEIQEQYAAIDREYERLRAEFADLRRPFNATAAGVCSDVWRFPTVAPHPGKHPCEKPLPLCEHIVRTSSRPGDVVLDNTCGSGAMAEAARNLGRRAIVGDMSPHWCRRTVDRLAQESLFADLERVA